MEADRPDVARRVQAGVEHLGPLRHVSSAARAEWLLWLQCAAADRVLRRVPGVRAGRDPDRPRDVSGRRESFSDLPETLRRQAVRTIDSFPDNDRLCRVSRGPRHARDHDRVREEHESYRDGNRRHEPVGNDLGVRRDLRRLGFVEQITMHHCIQGWTGIAKWGGVPMADLIRLVRPLPAAKVVAFFSFGQSLYGGAYYDTQRLENVLKPACILACEMNG